MTSEAEKRDPNKRVVKNQEDRPCGCTVTEYSDGHKVYAPCVPCGLFAVADHLRTAGEALAAVAGRMQRIGNQNQMQAAARAVAAMTAGKVAP